jgi:hypothetical protein
MWCYVMWCYVMWCYVMWCYVIWCYVMLCYVIWCYVMWCDVILCYVMLCDVMLCYVMLCYLMLCYVMLCYVMWCDVCGWGEFYLHVLGKFRDVTLFSDTLAPNTTLSLSLSHPLRVLSRRHKWFNQQHKAMGWHSCFPFWDTLSSSCYPSVTASSPFNYVIIIQIQSVAPTKFKESLANYSAVPFFLKSCLVPKVFQMCLVTGFC